MKPRKTYRNKTANAFMEYAVLLGIVSLAFATMNTYIKRGLQGRLADMSDYFIGQEHAADANPTANVTSNSSVLANTTAMNDEFSDGSIRLALLEHKAIETRSRVVDDPKAISSEDFIPAERGYVTVPTRPTEDDIKDVYDVDKENIKAQIRVLESKRDSLRVEAAVLERQATTIEARGRELIRRANGMSCPRRHGGSCRRARSNLARAGQDMVRQAQQMRQEARNKRAEANRIQTQIDQLRSRL